jgi:hypothetical protein
MVTIVVFIITPDYYQRIINKGEDMEVIVLSCIWPLTINLLSLDMQGGNKASHITTSN